MIIDAFIHVCVKLLTISNVHPDLLTGVWLRVRLGLSAGLT